MYQSSIKVSEVKEEAVQPSTTKNDYPSADDRTVDYRTTRRRATNEYRVTGPGKRTLKHYDPGNEGRYAYNPRNTYKRVNSEI